MEGTPQLQNRIARDLAADARLDGDPACEAHRQCLIHAISGFDPDLFAASLARCIAFAHRGIPVGGYRDWKAGVSSEISSVPMNPVAYFAKVRWEMAYLPALHDLFDVYIAKGYFSLEAPVLARTHGFKIVRGDTLLQAGILEGSLETVRAALRNGASLDCVPQAPEADANQEWCGLLDWIESLHGSTSEIFVAVAAEQMSRQTMAAVGAHGLCEGSGSKRARRRLL